MIDIVGESALLAHAFHSWSQRLSGLRIYPEDVAAFKLRRAPFSSYDKGLELLYAGIVKVIFDFWQMASTRKTRNYHFSSSTHEATWYSSHSKKHSEHLSSERGRSEYLSASRSALYCSFGVQSRMTNLGYSMEKLIRLPAILSVLVVQLCSSIWCVHLGNPAPSWHLGHLIVFDPIQSCNRDNDKSF